MIPIYKVFTWVDIIIRICVLWARIRANDARERSIINEQTSFPGYFHITVALDFGISIEMFPWGLHDLECLFYVK
jgi:hypothetical protein